MFNTYIEQNNMYKYADLMRITMISYCALLHSKAFFLLVYVNATRNIPF